MSDDLASGTAAAEITPPPSIEETRTVAAVLSDDVGFHRSQARHLHGEYDALHKRTHHTEWVVRTTERCRESTQELLRELADLGFAWRDVAQLVGVSVAAIQKWRRGEGTTGENRQKAASFLAACDLITEHFLVQEIASWFEVPVQMGVPLTPIDIWAGGRPDLVFEYASGYSDAEVVLTAWDPNWRERYRSDFETFRAEDGKRSIRPKGR
ncbi:hypothetical protein [Frankia sp. CiP3]|uniref:hypothetical protein n=1 Tax=Frankia sp. CiP3 TaxID=2880971 RepID=UPI001EF5782A|nr:hypothetical protein [Frankia sp. CiP3]